MRNPAVHWTEGMFLRPHHFQAADRYWSELAAGQIACDQPASWGLLRISLSEAALANGVLEFSGLTARWKDGALVVQDENQVVRTELKGRVDMAALGNQSLGVFLAIPALQEGQTNVAVGVPPRLHRYIELRRESDDESAGGNRQEVALRKLNFQVRFQTEELNGYDLIPLCRLKKSESDESQLVVDPGFFPPVLAVQSWPELAGVVRTIHDIIGGRIRSLGEVIQQKNISLSSTSQGDLEKLLLLHALNESYGELSCLATAGGVHPFVVYTALCRIVGRVSLFGPDLVIENVPRYNHDDLATIYRWALDVIRKLIYAVREDEYEQRYFIGAGRGMSVSLETEWFGMEWDWYFGVDPVSIGRDECIQLLKDTIDWKLGSTDMVESYLAKRMPGVKLRMVAEVPRALPSRGNWVYFQIKREEEAWKHVQVTQTMAMRVRSEQIANLETLEGARRLRLSIAGRTYGLEFAIFAVRKRI